MNSRAGLVRDIKNLWPETVSRAGIPSALPALPKGDIRLLGSSLKVEKGEAMGWTTRVLYMAPGSEAFGGDGRTLCPWAGSCEAVCLGHNSGQMAMSNSKRARLWKTAFYMGDRHRWRDLLQLEVDAFGSRGGKRAVRVDGTSDTGEARKLWSRGVQLYDYTKNLGRAKRVNTLWSPGLWHVTYSVSERSNLLDVDNLLRDGGNAAVVFAARKGEPLPKTWRGHEVVDGDAHDLRFLDGPGKVAGLRFKAARAPAAMMQQGIEGGFVFPAEDS